jgi:hypothetical protein
VIGWGSILAPCAHCAGGGCGFLLVSLLLGGVLWGMEKEAVWRRLL